MRERRQELVPWKRPREEDLRTGLRFYRERRMTRQQAFGEEPCGQEIYWGHGGKSSTYYFEGEKPPRSPCPKCQVTKLVDRKASWAVAACGEHSDL